MSSKLVEMCLEEEEEKKKKKKKKDEVSERCRTSHNEGLHNLYRSPGFVRVVNCRRL
jgi:hypothetical protein